MPPSLPYAADVESPLKPEELQVLRAQYEKEGEYVGLQTKFNYAWGLIKSTSRPDQQEGVRLLSEIFRNSRERRRECLYYLALGNYKLGNYAEARRYNELLLELEPANLQAGSLKSLIDEKVAKEGLLPIDVCAFPLLERCFLAGLLAPNSRLRPITLYITLRDTHAIMDQSSGENAQSHTQRPGHRDMMFCHECADEWYRDEHGLSCPECGSDFTEIIEENNDPRDSNMFGHDGDDSDSIPGFGQGQARNPHHNSSQNDDPEEDDISNIRFVQTAPGRYNLQATVTRSVSPHGGMPPGSIGGFMAMLNGLTGAGLRPQGQQQTPGQGQGEGLFSGPGTNQNQSAFHESQNEGTEGGPQIRGGRFTYHGGVRLFPPGGNGAGRAEPVDELTNVMTGLFAAFGAPPGHVHAHGFPQGGAQGSFSGEHTHGPGERVMGNPILNLFSAMGMMVPGAGNMGDFVYSQEGLDRIVSQLMEQTATSNAPGPATQADIDALPRKEVTEEMLGEEHKAECSICMDEVNIGEQVTMLPCKHWFHHPCISAWLLEHDTCPHCRKGITKGGQDQSGNPAPSGTHDDPTSQMPGAFTVGPQSSNQGNSSNNGDAGSGNGGISDRIRRGLFGSPQ
ncbi:hypothetical protein COCC4DRAFT_202787 [Bipolaris maydis ATCC 48331]|nr:uncharacterized protein COCC4DRAFT_202787 [Bipolaris maydis ATCC 48331]ENI02008.1 hypothetical protein COCC4DRAFT_202787 [Bipolaris maydis ATCC 48331]KAJ5028217.1 hypothetical protein J3E73DRAFT_187155 [Bipolaris maydis]KAJ6283523.1 hypothetical protein J3E71DRAFT_172472 [Bipolaris maydis]